jgi:hypothetical protein
MRLSYLNRLFTGLCVALGLGICGCASLPPVGSDGVGEQDRLTSHVRLLSSPKLEGRHNGSGGARLARDYIEERFRSDGLLPWGSEKSFEVAFKLGKNVVGVLPGSDTNLCREIVVLSAHYDHLGKNRKGIIYPGAADNASGVAALLETARQLSQAKERPKRTIAFVAFDAEEEMLLGSFAFCCRPDVEQARIVAVVNVDLLGRDFLEVMHHTLLIGGTGGHPVLQAQVREFGHQAGVQVLPLAEGLIGPRSDQAAFETTDALCLFFTCGPFTGYHTPADTADKLNFGDMEGSAKIIRETVEWLANQEKIPSACPGNYDRVELESAHAVVSTLSAHPERSPIKAEDLALLRKLKEGIENTLAGGPTDQFAADRVYLDMVDALLPYVMPGMKRTGSGAVSYHILAAAYLDYPREWLIIHKQLVEETLKHPPGLLRGFPWFRRELYQVRDGDISVALISSNTFALHALANGCIWVGQSRTTVCPFKSFRFEILPNCEEFDCEGSREQLVDYCLFQLYNDRTNVRHTQAVEKMLRAIPGVALRGSYTNWLGERLRQTSCDETNWLLAGMRSDIPDLVRAAVRAASSSRDPRIQRAACDILVNRNARGDVREAAMGLLARHLSRAALVAMTDVLDDQNPIYTRESMPQFQPQYPLTHTSTYLALHPLWEWRVGRLTQTTIGRRSGQVLTLITGKKFGRNTEAWQQWARQFKDN